MIAFAGVNAVGQKAMGDKPSSSKRYAGFQGNDSVLVSENSYTYNANWQIIKEIADMDFYTDSIITCYDADNRIVSVLSYRNNVLFHSKYWDYDHYNRRVNYCERTSLIGAGELDTVIHSVYYGVRNYNGDENPLSALIKIFLTDYDIDIEMRDCDSVVVRTYNGSGNLDVFMEIQPVYQSGKPASAKVKMNDFYMGLGDMTMDLVFSYNGNKLMNVNGAAVIFFYGIPVSFPNAIVLTNQYTNDLLTEKKVEMNLQSLDMYMGGTKQKYGYNSENNIAFLIEESSTDGVTWTIDSKTHYSYHIDNVEDIAIISLNNPCGLWVDNIGTDINLEVFLKNYSSFPTFNPINITALILASGDTIKTISEVIPNIAPNSVIKYTFTESYTVPDVSNYSLLIYIDSYDDNPLNDTLEVIRTAGHREAIKNMRNVDFSMSQNIPNPAKDVAFIHYNIPADGEVLFVVYNLNGQLVFSQRQAAQSGENTLRLPVSNLESGIYFYSMEYHGQRIVRKMSVEK